MHLSQGAFTEKEIIRSETNILNKLGWDLLIANPSDFLQIYKWLGVVFSDDWVQGSDGNLSIPSSWNIECINKYLEFFADLVI